MSFGSAVENAAVQHRMLLADGDKKGLPHCLPQEISFKELFGETTAADDRRQAVAEVLALLRRCWREGAGANEIAAYIRTEGSLVLELFGALGAATNGWAGMNRTTVTSQLIAGRLGILLNRVVVIGDEWFQLCFAPNNIHKESGKYVVKEVMRPPST